MIKCNNLSLEEIMIYDVYRNSRLKLLPLVYNLMHLESDNAVLPTTSLFIIQPIRCAANIKCHFKGVWCLKTV